MRELETALLQKMMDTTMYLQKEVFMVGKRYEKIHDE